MSLINREVLAGLFLLVIAGVAYVGAGSLPAGSLGGIGSGLVPKSTAILLAGFGLFIAGMGLVARGEPMAAWSFRSILFVLGAVLAFAVTIRPLGLMVSAPAAIMLSALADPDTRPAELVIFTTLFSVLCVVLFKFMLRLPIPLMPPLLGY